MITKEKADKHREEMEAKDGVFRPSGVVWQTCPCGCNQIKLLMYDAQGRLRAAFECDPEMLLPILQIGIAHAANALIEKSARLEAIVKNSCAGSA